MNDDYKFIDLSEQLQKASFDSHLNDIENKNCELDDETASMIRTNLEKFFQMLLSNNLSYFSMYMSMFNDQIQSFGQEVAEILLRNNLIQEVYPFYTELDFSNQYAFQLVVYKLIQNFPDLAYEIDSTIILFLLDTLNAESESRAILVALCSIMYLFKSNINEIFTDEILSRLHISFKSLYLYRPSDDPVFCEIEDFNDDVDKFCRLNVHIAFLNCFSSIFDGPPNNFIELFIGLIAESYQSRVLQIAESSFSGLCKASEKYPKNVQDILIANHFTRFLSIIKRAEPPHSIITNIILIQSRISFLFDEKVLCKMSHNNVWFLIDHYIEDPELFQHIVAIVSNCMLLDKKFCQATMVEGYVERLFDMFSEDLPKNEKEMYAVLFGSIMKHSITEIYCNFIERLDLIESIAFSLDQLKKKNLNSVLQGFIRLMRYQLEISEEPTIAQVLSESEIFTEDSELYDKSKSVSCLMDKTIQLIDISLNPE